MIETLSSHLNIVQESELALTAEFAGAFINKEKWMIYIFHQMLQIGFCKHLPALYALSMLPSQSDPGK